MTLQAFNFTHSESEFGEMRALLRAACAASKRPLTWRLPQHENWHYAAPLPQQRAHLWRDPSGSLAAFCLSSDSVTHLVLAPAFEHDAQLKETLLDWVEEHWSSPGQPVELLAYEHDIEQRRLLAQRGYLDEGYVSWLRVYDLNRDMPGAALPPGFRFATLAESGTRDERIELERAVWKKPGLDQDWFKGRNASPFYSFDWDLLAVSSQRELAAFVLLWLDKQYHSAEIAPMGTAPDYRHQGIARALVIEAYQRLSAAGISRLTIESESDPDHPANRLYASLSPIETHGGRRWVKRF